MAKDEYGQERYCPSKQNDLVVMVQACYFIIMPTSINKITTFGLFYIVDCQWSDWGPWNKCSLTCGEFGSGTIERCRHVHRKEDHGGKPCNGEKKELRACPHHDCVNRCKQNVKDCICLEVDKAKKDEKYGIWIKKCPGKIDV